MITGITKDESSVEILKIDLEFFAVRNQDGQFFHAVGLGGGKTWVNDIKSAKIYPKIGQARARVTWFTNNYPKYASPVIIKIIANKAIVLDETERVKKAIEKIEKKEAEYRKRQAEYELKRAKEDARIANDKLKRLKNKEW